MAGLRPARRGRSHERRLVNFHSEAVAGAVKEPLHPPVAALGFVALRLEEPFHGPMDAAGGFAGAHFEKREFLPLLYRVVETAHGFAGLTPHDGAGDVAEVTGLL